MTTQQLLADNLSLLTANSVDTTDFLKKSPEDAYAVINQLNNNSPEAEQDIFAAASEEDEEQVEPLGPRPVQSDYSSNTEFFQAAVEWLLHKDQEPVILTDKVEVGGMSFELNGQKLNTEYGLMNKDKNTDKVYYRHDTIKLCFVILNNGADKVNEHATVTTEFSTDWGGSANLEGFDIVL